MSHEKLIRSIFMFSMLQVCGVHGEEGEKKVLCFLLQNPREVAIREI